MSNIKISESRSAHIASQNVEYVERKGMGHPDSLIDGIVERASVELSKAYMDNTGMILHHNLDKGLIIGADLLSDIFMLLIVSFLFFKPSSHYSL